MTHLGRWLPWSLLVLSSMFLVTAGVTALIAGTGGVLGTGLIMWAVALVFGVTGALVASRQSVNPIGWIFLGASLAASSTVLAEAYAAYHLEAGSGSRWLAASFANYDQVSWVPFVVAPTTFVLLLVPDGRPLGRRWRWIGWFAGIGMIATFITQGLVRGPIPAYPRLNNPYGIAGSSTLLPFQIIVGILVAVGIVGSAASLIVRFRRARGVERLQLKWLAFAGAVAGVIILFGTTAGYALVGADASNVVIMIGVMTLPVATGTAILRYRLYDIDLVINRAVVYGALTAILAGMYLGSILVLQLALAGVTNGSGLPVAASTLATAALVRPARTRIQSVVDRRFFRAKYNAALTLTQFAVRLRNQVDLGEIRSDLLGVVQETVQPTRAWLWLPDSVSQDP